MTVLHSFSVSHYLLVVAATVRCCRWNCTSEHTDAEDNNQIDQYSHSMSVYQHFDKWYKYSLSFLALISTTETPPPFCPLNQIDRPADPLQTASQHYCTNCTLTFCLCFSLPLLHHCWRRPHSLIIKVSFSAFCCSWESASRRKQHSSYCELNHWVTPAVRHWNYWWHFKCFTAKRRLSNESESLVSVHNRGIFYKLNAISLCCYHLSIMLLIGLFIVEYYPLYRTPCRWVLFLAVTGHVGQVLL